VASRAADDTAFPLDALPRTAWLEIDLDAIQSNLAVVRGMAGEGNPVHAVVKADAYGHGAIPVSRALAAAGVDGFCVATLDEGLVLRRARVRLPILVLYPVPPAWAVRAARARLAITAGDAGLLSATLAALAAEPPPRPLAIHLEVETGLGRGGFGGSELAAPARSVAASPHARLAGLWTHLQAPENRDSASEQAARFELAADELAAAGFPVRHRHLRASGSLVAGGVIASDGVRPGLSLYGLIPDELLGAPLGAEAAHLRPALSLRARPVRVIDLPAGWGISYGPSYRASRPSRIATLPVGYGDGWGRSLSNRAEALVRGIRVPLVGTVAMDAVMADVTDVPGRPVTSDDEFCLIGRQGGDEIPVAEVARRRATNSWEVVTAMSGRLPRVYHAASGPMVIRTLVSRGDG
jgi:alanine racemase